MPGTGKTSSLLQYNTSIHFKPNNLCCFLSDRHFTDSLCPTFCGIDTIESLQDVSSAYIAVPQDKTVGIYSLSRDTASETCGKCLSNRLDIIIHNDVNHNFQRFLGI